MDPLGSALIINRRSIKPFRQTSTLSTGNISKYHGVPAPRLPGVLPYFDDVLIVANSGGELLAKLKAVLLRFCNAGLRLKKSKCHIVVPAVEFLGYHIDARGTHPTQSKVEAIKKALAPTNKAEGQVFLGFLNFYSIFVPHKASVTESLHWLLDSSVA